MELKGIVAVVIDESLQFQSHLYGIESCLQPREGLRRLVSIAPLWNWKISSQLHRNACHSFNRTFMELKVKMFEPVLEEKSFQSHLYGIESNMGAPYKVGVGGFNRTFMELKGQHRGTRNEKNGLQIVCSPWTVKTSDIIHYILQIPDRLPNI